MSELIAPPLSRQEVVKAVTRRNPSRVPLIFAKWWGEGLGKQYGERLNYFDRYPNDFQADIPGAFSIKGMGLSWLKEDGRPRGLDTGGIIPDWKYLDEFIAKLPDPEAPGRLDNSAAKAQAAHRDDQYFLYGWWNFFFELPWALRGMENLMLDYYDNGDQIHRLHEALCNQYVGLIRRAGREFQPDGFWTSDDLGNQRQLMMKPDHFREFLKPYYRRVATACHECGMHFWMHSCGNNTEVLDDLIEVGLDVFHPVQKHTMEEREIARRFGDRLTFLVGFDVQQLLPKGSPEEVRAEVRHLIDTFDRPDGGMCLAAGNGIVGGTPFENIDAFLDEALKYGLAHRQKK
ncbi:MAG: uroporphyrinogen decarboxylase family protein [Phycisphaerae bacterium]